MSTAKKPTEKASPPRPGIALDESRLEMMRRQKRMSAQERVLLFERLSRDAAWARSAKRVR